MKILNVLVNESAAVAYRDLTDMQTTVLMRVAAGQTSYDTASPREQGIMDELAEMGLLSDLVYEPTQKGAMVANMARKYGSRDARVLQQRNTKAGVKPVVGDGRYSDVGDAGDNLDGAMAPELDGQSLRNGEIHR